MLWLKKLVGITAAFLLVFMGLWLVVVNDQNLSLNLLFFAVPEINAGIALLLSFAVGSMVGLLVGFNLFSLFKLNTKLYWLKREVRQLQDALSKNRH
jgi:uncharacterized integral membrane protein